MTQALEDSTSPVTMPPKRGRKALPDLPMPDMGEANRYADAVTPVMAGLRQNSVTLHKGELRHSLSVAETVGMITAFQFNEAISRVGMLKKFQELRDTKAYKGLTLTDKRTGELITVQTWEDFCEANGYSKRKIDEDLQNLATFGEGLLEAQEALGLGYRELRLLRAGIKSLPPEEQQKVLDDMQAVEGSEEAKALLNDVRIKLAETEIALKDAKDDMTAKEKLSKSKSDRLDKLQEQVIKLTSMNPDEQDKIMLEKNQQAKKDFDEVCLKTMGTFAALAQKAAAILQHDESTLDTCRYVHGRVSLLCQSAAETLTLAGVDVSFGDLFELPDIGEALDEQGTTSTAGEA